MPQNERWLNRLHWRELGRIVVAPNSEARDVVFYRNAAVPGLMRGAWHVFAKCQTVPVEQEQAQ